MSANTPQDNIKRSRLKVAILKCDDVLDKFQAHHLNYPEMISTAFWDIDPAIDFDSFDLRDGAYPSDISVYDFYVITGSKASVYEPLPWIKESLKFLRKLSEAEKKVFGICFGHQLLALVNGCLVEKSGKGWGVGVAKASTFGELSNALSEGKNLSLLVSHQDQVVDLSPDATLLASTEFCPNFAVRWDSNALSVQGHPEWKSAYAYELMNDRRDRIPAPVISKGIESLSISTNSQEFLAYVLRFLSA